MLEMYIIIYCNW